jgi:tetratricopeptide (TPR) repeat protein
MSKKTVIVKAGFRDVRRNADTGVRAVPRRAGDSMGFAGELTTIGLSEVFQNVAFNRLTGVLTVSDRDRRASVCLEDGVIRAFRPEGDRQLDYVAIAERAHAASADTLRQAARRLRRRTLKEALRAIATFDEDRFDAAVQAAVKEEVILLFSWREASFVFEEGRPQNGLFDKEQLDSNVSLDPHVVIVEAARRVDEWDAIAHQIRSENDIFLPAKALPEEGTVPAWREVVSRLDGTRDVRTLIRELPLSRFETLRHLAALCEQGLIVRAEPAQLCALARAAEEAKDAGRAVRLLEAALAMDPAHLEARHELIRLYERTGKRPEAAGEYKRLGQSQEAAGDPQGALESYGKASGLVPYDVEALERIAAIHEKGDGKEYMRAGLRLAEALSTQSLLEEALAVYKKLLSHDQESVVLRESIAATYIKLHESKPAARELIFLAQRAWDREEFDRALHYYRNVLAVDRDHEEARKRITEIEQTRLSARGRRRRRRAAFTFFALLFGALLWQGTREWFATEALYEAGRAALTGITRRHTEDVAAEAIEAYARVPYEFPWTVAGGRAEDTVRALLLDQLASIRAEAHGDADTAEKRLRRLSRVKWPGDVRRLWSEGRDGALDDITRSRGGK